MEKLLKSRTIRLAFVQALTGFLVVVFTELDMVGYVTLVKSVADVYLRLDTTAPVGE